MTQPNEFAISHTILIRASTQLLYDMVSDVTRTGEFSPSFTPAGGTTATVPDRAWFTGRKQTAGRTWETRSQVTVAAPARAFAFVVGGAGSEISVTKRIPYGQDHDCLSSAP